MPDAGDTESRPADGPPPGPRPWPTEPGQQPAAEPPVQGADEGETQPIDPALLQIARQEAARTAAAGEPPPADPEPAADEEKPKRLGPKPPELRGRPVTPAQPTTALPPAGYRPGLTKTPMPAPGAPPMPPPAAPPPLPPPSPWARPGGQPTPVPSGPPSTGAPYAGPPHPGPGHTGQQPAIPAHPGPGHTGQQPAIPSTGPGFGAGAPPRKSGKVWWIVGGVAAAFLLIVGCGVGVTLVVLPSMTQQVIVQGECVKRAGDRTLVPSACQAPGALKVLQRLDDTADGSKCPKQTTTIFTHREDDDTYVLCLGTP